MATLIRPPPNDPAISSMENTLELTQLYDVDPNLFTNTRPLWRPPGARGVYGGAVIAQCLAAAQKTVDSAFTVHSMHCYFVLAGNAEIPIIYHVERVRDGKSFATRTVQARQRAKAIFTVTLSFQRDVKEGVRTVQHATPMPKVSAPDEEGTDYSHGPFESRALPSINNDAANAHAKRTRMWIRTRGKISQAGGHQAHLSALAYMSDSFFIGTVARAHRLWREYPPQGDDKNATERKSDYESDNERSEKSQTEDMVRRVRHINGGKSTNEENRPEIGMMVSLDHTIYFHGQREFRADDWLLSEMWTPWSGDNRGVVMQQLWTRDGQPVATCYQEGLIRLKQNDNSSKL